MAAASVSAGSAEDDLLPLGSWVEPSALEALCLLLGDDRKGNPRRKPLAAATFRENVAPFLRFDAPLPDQLYALGGRNEEQGPLDVVEMFDTWQGRWVSCPSMEAKRGGCAGAALPDGRLFVAGGYDARGIVNGILGTCEAFDPYEQKWSTDCAAMMRARWGHGCALLGGLVYAAGGCALARGAPASQDFMETLQSCEAYDYLTDRWQTVPDLLVARGGSRLVAVGDHHLVAVGGCDDVFGRAEMLPTVELFDAFTSVWTLLDARLSVPRTTAAVAALDDDRLLVVGGASAEVATALATAEVYSLTACQKGMSPLSVTGSTAEPDAADVLQDFAEHELFASLQDATPSYSSTGSPYAAEARGSTAASEPLVVDKSGHSIENAADGRMGCQAITINLPAPGSDFPLRTRRCVVVVGGEEDEGEGWDDFEEAPPTRQFSSVLVYDTVEGAWRPEGAFPPMPTPRTAMALCVGLGRASRAPQASAGQAAEPPAKRRRSGAGEGVVDESPVVDH